MKRKTINYILIGFFAFVLFAGAEIAGVRLRFGSAFINDTTASYVSLNKGLKINGLIMVNDSVNAGARLTAAEIYLEGIGATITWGGYGGYITEGAIDQLNYGSNNHVVETEYGTDLVQIDSTEGLISYIPGYSDQGRGLLKTKVLQSTLGATTPGNFLSIAHGISQIRNIVTWSAVIYEDSLTTWLCPGYNRATPITVGTVFDIDATNARWFIPAASGSLKNSGDSIRWIIRYLE